jgi:hypothetical protein
LVEDEGEDDGEGRGGERKVEEETLLWDVLWVSRGIYLAI